MNILERVALQGLKKNRTRTLVTIAGVALSAALVTAAVTFGLSLLSYAARGAAQKYGGWHAAFMEVDEAFAQRQSQNPQVEAAVAAESLGYAPLAEGDGSGKPYLYLMGFSPETFAALPVTLISGRMPENSGEVLLPSHLLADGGAELALGDRLSLPLGSRRGESGPLGQQDPYSPGEAFTPLLSQSYTVVGIYRRPAFEEDAAPGYTLITAAGGQAKALDLYVTLKDPAGVKSYAAASGHSYQLNNQVLRFLGLSEDAGDGLFNALLYAIGGVVLAIIMVGSVFLIYNAFSISLNERMQQLGILASVGATARQIRGSVLFEGLCIGACGIPLGVLLGLLGVRAVIAVVAQRFASIMYSGVSLTLCLSAPALLGAAAISLLTILLSAYLPARRAAAMPVMECIRQTNQIKVEAGAVKTSRLAQRVLGLEGTLALKNFKRNRRQYRSIVLSLVLSVTLFISASAFGGDLKQAMAPALSFTTYNVGLGTKSISDATLLALQEKALAGGGVMESACQAVLDTACALPAGALPSGLGQPLPGGEAELPMELQFLDSQAYGRLLQGMGLDPAQYTGENGRAVAVAKKMPSQQAGEKQLSDFEDLFEMPTVEARVYPVANGQPDRQQGLALTLRLVETLPPDIPPTREGSLYGREGGYYFQILLPWAMKEKLAPSDEDLLVKGLTFTAQHPAQLTESLRAALEGGESRGAYLLIDTTQAFEENRNYVFIADVFAYTFTLMISLIAVANVFNTISTNIRLRRRELAMLRSVGMGDRAFHRMMCFECAFYGLRALAVGLPLAALCCWLIYRSMFTGGAEGIRFTLPWASMGVSVLSVLLVIFVTMLYAVGKLKKENIIDALRDELA